VRRSPTESARASTEGTVDATLADFLQPFGAGVLPRKSWRSCLILHALHSPDCYFREAILHRRTAHRPMLAMHAISAAQFSRFSSFGMTQLGAVVSKARGRSLLGQVIMCITQAVGRMAPNLHDDVRTVQILLNMNAQRLVPFQLLRETGVPDEVTCAGIETYQTRVMRIVADGRVEPKSKTLKALRDGTPIGFLESTLAGILIRASHADVKRFYQPLRSGMTRYGIQSPLRMAHFLAQVGHESGNLRFTEEIASGRAYEGREDLGNTEVGDGARFKGRGLIQLTGRTNYTRYGKAKGADYVRGTHPQLLSSDPFLAVDVAGWFWSIHKLNHLADSDNVIAITKKVNGGHNGIADRRAILLRAKFFFVERASGAAQGAA
jgi:putative chitinase